MPILYGLISTLFYALFEVVIKRLAFNLAFAAALVSTMAIAYGLFRVGLAAIWSASLFAMPSAVSTAFVLVFPGNMANVIASCVLVDVIMASWQAWKLYAGIAAAAVKG